MQYRLNHKLRTKDLKSDFDQIGEELQASIQYEKHRDNVDRAKKRAVKQLMDYEQFEQMVKGADLKSLKTLEVKELVEMKPKVKRTGVFNTTSELRQESKFLDKEVENKENQNNVEPGTEAYPSQVLQNKEKVSEESKDIDFPVVKNFREFKKAIDQILGKKPLIKEKETLLRFLQTIDENKYRRIFSINFEIQYLVIIFDILYERIIDSDFSKENYSEFRSVLEFLGDVAKIPGFNINIKKRLHSSEKLVLKRVLNVLEERAAEFEELVTKVRKSYI